MKVVILGMDGLDSFFVKKFDLKNLKQKEYGKTNLSDFDLIITSSIWASFITGLLPSQHGIETMWEWENALIRMLDKLSKFRGPSRRLFTKIGFRKRDLRVDAVRRRGIRNIFDEITNSVAINVPTYNWERNETLEKLLFESIEDKEKYPLYKSLNYKRYSKNKQKILEILKTDNWELLMGFVTIVDALGHVRFGDIHEMFEVYSELEQFVIQVKSILNDDTLLLIVSDHGMKPFGKSGWFGDHSNYGFYSVNIPLNLDSPKITDFRIIILNALKEGNKNIETNHVV